jgi:hypothetical protein
LALVETQPELHPALLRLSAMIFQHFIELFIGTHVFAQPKVQPRFLR